MKGRTLPRLYTEPLPGRRRGDSKPGGCPCRCGLTPATSHGFTVIRWGRSIGIRLHPWQRWLLIHALELDALCAGYRFRTVLVLVARQNGKTLVKSLLSLWRMYDQNAPYLVGTAQDLSQAREVMNEVLAPMMLGNPKLSERFDPENADQSLRRGIWRKQLNDEFIRLDSRWVAGRAVAAFREEDGTIIRHGPRYLIKALNRSAGRGLAGVREVNIDELREQRDFLGWAAVSKTVMAAGDAQIWCMSNAGDSSSLLLNHLRGVALGGNDDTMFHAEWSAEPGCALDDRAAWAQANPSLGYGDLTEASIRSALKTDPPAVFRTEVLCQFVDSMNAAIDPFAWAAQADRGGSMDGLRRRLAMAVEVAQDGAHVSAVVAAELPDDGRVRFEVVGAWENTTAARRGLPELRDLLKPRAIGWFPNGPGAALSNLMSKRLRAKPIKGAAVIEACMTFADYVEGRHVLHADQALLNEHIARTSKIGSRGSWMFDRSTPEHIDCAYAAAGAMHLALALPTRRPPRIILPSGGGDEP